MISVDFDFRFVFQLGLVCFRLVGNQGMTIESVNKMNQKLLEAINDSGKLHMVPSKVNDKFIIRFCVVAHDQTQDDIGKPPKKSCFIFLKTCLN